MERPISFEQQIRVTFETATTVLETEADEVILDDADTGTLALDASLAGFTVSRPVSATLGELDHLDPQAVAVPISWEAAEHPRRFPTFEGILELSALAQRPAQSKLALIGKVKVPLGVLGSIGEAAGGSQIGDDVLEALLERIAQRLVAAVAARQAASAAATTPSHLSRPRFVAEDD